MYADISLQVAKSKIHLARYLQLTGVAKSLDLLIVPLALWKKQVSQVDLIEFQSRPCEASEKISKTDMIEVIQQQKNSLKSVD